MSSHGRDLIAITIAVPMIVACSGAGSGSPSGTQVASDGGGAQATSPSAPAPACTGPIPANATSCPGSESGLTSDAPRKLVEVCACDSSCRATTPCSYACDAGYVLADGACTPVAPSPTLHFADNGDGTVTVTDGDGALVWLKAADCYGPVPWPSADSWCAALADGTCGLHDGSAPGDWRLPTQIDLQKLAAKLSSPAYASAGRPFTGISSDGYWSSFTTCNQVYTVVEVSSGDVFDTVPASLPFAVWPVRLP